MLESGMAYQRGDYIALGVRELILYGFAIGAVFFGCGWLARPVLDDHVAVIADEGPIGKSYVQGDYQWVFYRDPDGKLHQALAKMYLGPGSPLGYPKAR
jgi:hypothetical protein